MSKDKITEKEIEKMGDYFTAIIAIAERGNEEYYCSAIKTIAMDASNFFYKITKEND